MTSTTAFGYPPKEKPQKPKGKDVKAAPVEKVTVEDLFRWFEETPPSDMAPCIRLWEIFHAFFLQTFASQNLISLKALVLAGNGTPVYIAAQERKTRTCKCPEKGFAIASATVSITSLTVISAGIPTVTVITTDMTYTC